MKLCSNGEKPDSGEKPASRHLHYPTKTIRYEKLLPSLSSRISAMRAKVTLSALLLSFIGADLFAQAPPLVYTVENTGGSCVVPPLPSFSQLPVVEPLTDPFMWSDGR